MTDSNQQQVQVRITGLDKTFRRRREAVHVLRAVDLEVNRGELLVLLGPSGCGKTTLLRCLVGLERPDSGTIELGGQTVVDTGRGVVVQPNRRDVGMVFQNYALWPHMTVRQNVAYPLRARRLRDQLRAGRVDEVLSVVQCDHLADRYPPELSGGQQQRVSLARALAPKPALLLLDEPLSNLDALLRIELRAQLRHLHRELGFTGVYVTHDQQEALNLGTRVAVMRDGQFEQLGTPDEVHRRPATDYVAEFLGARNRLDLRIDADGTAAIAGSQVGPLFDGAGPGTYRVRVRPSHLLVRATGADSRPSDRVHWLSGGSVVEALPGGDTTDYMLDHAGTFLYAQLPSPQATLRPGDPVDIGLDADALLVYGEDGRLVDALSGRVPTAAAV